MRKKNMKRNDTLCYKKQMWIVIRRFLPVLKVVYDVLTALVKATAAASAPATSTQIITSSIAFLVVFLLYSLINLLFMLNEYFITTWKLEKR